jgi:hypothetical protein
VIEAQMTSVVTGSRDPAMAQRRGIVTSALKRLETGVETIRTDVTGIESVSHAARTRAMRI